MDAVASTSLSERGTPLCDDCQLHAAVLSVMVPLDSARLLQAPHCATNPRFADAYSFQDPGRVHNAGVAQRYKNASLLTRKPGIALFLFHLKH